MSKSLKNFITIKELLKVTTARIIRLYFFLHRYDVILSYDPETSLQEASEKDKRYKNFFGSLAAAIRDQPISLPQKSNELDVEFDSFLQKAEAKIYEAFSHNINTPEVIGEVDEAIKKTNTYLESKERKIGLLEKAYKILIRPFNAMGLYYETHESSTN